MGHDRNDRNHMKYKEIMRHGHNERNHLKLKKIWDMVIMTENHQTK